MPLSLIPTAAPLRPESTPAARVPLVGQLGAALASRGVRYCQWKGHGKRERWESGKGDIDLLVDRASWPEFVEILTGLGFKLALPPPGREAAGIVHYFGFDERTGQLIHVHAYQRLVIGSPWRTHYRIPLERALLDSTAQRTVFKTAAPELELVVLVLRQSLRHEPWDLLRRKAPAWLDGALSELDRLEEQVSRDRVLAALSRYLPEVSPDLYERCRDSLLPNRSAWQRIRVRLALARALSAHAAHPPIFALGERLWARLYPIGQRLAGGGSVVALLGGDGSGKSTCAEALYHWLGTSLATLHVHLGRPTRSLATLVVGAALKISGGPQSKLRAHLELLRSYCTARDRYHEYRRARRFATAGGIAICERYPTPESWPLSGPSDVQGHALSAQSRFAARVRRAERRYYDRITAPDLTFLLQVDPETAVARKKNEPAEYVRKRALLTWETDWSRSGARIIDAAQPLTHVVGTLKNELWRTL